MTTFKVAAGHYVDLEHPTVDMIDLDSICASLSKLCRFGGHCPRFYSVAEHCCHAGDLAIQDKRSREAVLAVLLHDATEAYIGDIINPLKMMLPGINKIERRLARKISETFGVDFEKHEAEIKRYDLLMLKAEKTAFWSNDSEGWGLDHLPLRDVHFQFWSPEWAGQRLKMVVEKYF